MAWTPNTPLARSSRRGSSRAGSTCSISGVSDEALNATQLIPGLGTVMALGAAGAVVLGAVGAAVGKAFDGVPSLCTWKRSGVAGAW